MSIFSWSLLQSGWNSLLPWFLTAYLVTTAIQLILWWGLFYRLAGKGDPPGCSRRPDSPENPPPDASAFTDDRTSVVICARNEANNLKVNLPSVLDQHYPGYFEVVVVNDASADETAAVLDRFQAIYPHLRVLHLPEKTAPGKKHALSGGIETARFDTLVFTDADCRPSSACWLRYLTNKLADGTDTEIVLGYGPLTPGPGLLNAWARYETAYTALQYFSFALSGVPYMGVGRNMAIKKKVYERVGGFQTHRDLASGDDDLLVNEAARGGHVRICTDPNAFMYSEAQDSWRAWIIQKTRHLSAGTRYRKVHLVLLGFAAASHVLHYGLLLLLVSGGYAPGFVLTGYMLRMLSLRWVLGKILPALGEPGLVRWVPLFDACMAVYFAAAVPLAFIGKYSKTGWK